jgi:hypothetical protein
MTAYTKTNLGNKLFIIEWNLVVTGGVLDVGDIFEAEDCVPLSLHAFSPSGVFVKLDVGNMVGESQPVQISGQFFVPANDEALNANSTINYNPKPIMPPPMRFWKPTAEANPNDGTARIAILFKEA